MLPPQLGNHPNVLCINISCLPFFYQLSLLYYTALFDLQRKAIWCHKMYFISTFVTLLKVVSTCLLYYKEQGMITMFSEVYNRMACTCAMNLQVNPYHQSTFLLIILLYN